MKKPTAEISGFDVSNLVIGDLYQNLNKYNHYGFKPSILMCLDIKDTRVPGTKKGFFVVQFHDLTLSKYETYIADHSHSGKINIEPYTGEIKKQIGETE